MANLYEMTLRRDPFDRILRGEKTIEYRLHDKKRSLLKVGDQIRFTNGERSLLVEILQIVAAPSFVDLKEELLREGLLGEEPFSPESMLEYYPHGAERKYGVVGIKMKLLG